MGVGATEKLTAYDWLGVHPNAPLELISASYWLAAGALQTRRSSGERVDETLFTLTRAYEVVSDGERRSNYDLALGHDSEPLTKRRLPRVRRTLRGRLFGRSDGVGAFDLYEVLGLAPDAPPEMLQAAHHIMRNHYLRVPDEKRRNTLLYALDAALEALGDPEKRAKYDKRKGRVGPSEQSRESKIALDDRDTRREEPAMEAQRDTSESLPQAPEVSGSTEAQHSLDEREEAAAEAQSDISESLSRMPEVSGSTEAQGSLDEREEAGAEAQRDTSESLSRAPEGSISTEAQDSLGEAEPEPGPSVVSVISGAVLAILRTIARWSVAILRVVGRGVRAAWRRASTAWYEYRSRRADAQQQKEPRPIQPPIRSSSKGTHLSREAIEEALLGRLETLRSDDIESPDGKETKAE
jgi:curved DNA-binding protein CbpA